MQVISLIVPYLIEISKWHLNHNYNRLNNQLHANRMTSKNYSTPVINKPNCYSRIFTSFCSDFVFVGVYCNFIDILKILPWYISPNTSYSPFTSVRNIDFAALTMQTELESFFLSISCFAYWKIVVFPGIMHAGVVSCLMI